MTDTNPRPNLFILGAAKCATTSLHDYLNSHPDIFMCDPKEPAFFVEENKAYPKDPAWYSGLFAEAGDAKILGESSTHYTKLPLFVGVPEKIAAFSPEARFIYIMRDPVERAISHYWHRVRFSLEHRPILQAIKKDIQYTTIGDYRMQLEPYFALFGRQRVLLLTFERLIRTPRDVLEDVFTWLGVDPTLGTREFRPTNARPVEVEKVRGAGLLFKFAKTPLWNRLSPLAPTWFKRIGTGLSIGPVQPASIPTDEVKEYLRPIYREKIPELEKWLGMDFPDWTTVFPERSSRSSAPTT